MIVTDSLDLAGHDPTIAGLSIMIDTERMADWLTTATARLDDHQQLLGLQPGYLRYKPGTSLVVGYRTGAGPLFGYAVSPDAGPKLDKLVDKAPAGSIVAHDRERRMVLARPAADRDLPGLLTPTGMAAKPLAYKPQRRLVGSLDDRMVRCYRPSDLSAIQPRWPAAGLVEGVRVPEIISADRRSGLVTVERLSGVPLDRSTGPALIAGLQAAGEALARWHRDAPVAPRPADLPVPSAAADQLSQILPQEASRIAALARAVARLQAEVDQHPEVGWCHGDFSVDQILSTGDGRASLLDWDRSGNGPLAADLANADAAGSGDTIGLEADAWQAMLLGYQRVRPLPAGLPQFRVIARFTRAVDPFRTARADWPRAVRANLDRVQEML